MSRTARILAILAVVTAVTIGVVWIITRRHPEAPHAGPVATVTVSASAAPTSSSSSGNPVVDSSSTPARTPLRSGGPETVASAYVTHALSLDWHWNGAAGYLAAIKPLSTPEHWRKDLAPLASLSSGAAWEDAKAGHVLWTVTVRTASIVTAAPKSAVSCWVRVVYDELMTGDADHGRPGGVPVSGTVNVAMQRIGGKWLVGRMSTDGG